MLSGEVEADAGEIARPNGLTVGYLPQDGLTHAGRTLYDETSRAFEPLLALQAELRNLEIRLGDTSLSATEHDAALARYSEVQTAFQDRDGYGIEAKVDAVLRGLGFEGTDFEKPTETFSGGARPLRNMSASRASARMGHRSARGGTISTTDAVAIRHEHGLSRGGQTHVFAQLVVGAPSSPTERVLLKVASGGHRGQGRSSLEGTRLFLLQGIGPRRPRHHAQAGSAPSCGYAAEQASTWPSERRAGCPARRRNTTGCPGPAHAVTILCLSSLPRHHVWVEISSLFPGWQRPVGDPLARRRGCQTLSWWPTPRSVYFSSHLGPYLQNQRTQDRRR